MGFIVVSVQCISGHSASVTVLGLLKKVEKKKELLVQKDVLAVFRLAVVINGLDRSGHTPVCCLATCTYFNVIHTVD